MKKQSTDEQIIDKLDKILKVLSIQIAGDKSMTEAARMLKLAGLDNRTIALVLNTSENSISVLTSGIRKKQKNKIL